MTSTSTSLSALAGSRVVVTGSTNGIGLATARSLARAGLEVVLAVRNVELGESRAREFGGRCSVLRLDLADLDSVRTFADELDGDIDILINNAGMFPHRHRETPDGFEAGIGTNFLGPFALTNLLLPRIRKQIVTVGSEAHRNASIDAADLNFERTQWNAPRAYARSKLAVMLWGLELDRRLRTSGSSVTSMLTDPGWAASKHLQQAGPRCDPPRRPDRCERPRQRSRSRCRTHAVLHHRAHPAGQLRRRRRPARSARVARAGEPDTHGL